MGRGGAGGTVRRAAAMVTAAALLAGVGACGSRWAPAGGAAGGAEPVPAPPASPAGPDADAAAPGRPPERPPAGAAEQAPAPSPPGREDLGRPGRQPATVEVAYRVERRTSDAATADFVTTVDAVLADPRGWGQAGFRFVRRDDAPHLVVLAEGPEVDELCRPYETWSTYSCQNGPVVALNADRWRQATPQWPADLASYRVMLVNHEVGHLLGQRHVDCPGPGLPAPVMTQQSTSLHGCEPNPWPLPSEIALAARHEQPLAPGYGE